MPKRMLGLALLGSVILSGCAHIQKDGASEEVRDNASIAKSPSALGKDSQVVFLLLSAELAGQRGQFDVAVDHYLKAANLSKDGRIAARATQVALYTKNADKAREAAAVWQERDPEGVEPKRLLVFLDLKAGRRDQALNRMGELLQSPGVQPENLLIELVKAVGTELSKEDALKFMQELTARFPKLAEVHFAYALLAAEKGEHRTALQEIELALAQHPDWNRARLLQAQVMSQMGDSAAAREVIQRALKSEPDNVRLRLIYSQLLARTGNSAGAVSELQRILKREPENEDARFGLGMAYMELGKHDLAKAEFTRLSDSSRWKTQSYFYLGLIEARRNHLGAATEWFDKVNEGALAFDAKINAISALIGQGEIPEARLRLADTRKKFPHEALRLYLLEAELLSKKQDAAAAFDLLSEALEEFPGQPELLYTRALLAEQLDRLEVLEADLRAVIEKNPNDPNALNALGYTLADRFPDRLNEARRYLDRAIELKPDDPAVLDSYGWLNYKLGDYETALRYLRRAYQQIKDPEIGAHFGEVLWEAGQRREAKRVWIESSRKAPEHRAVQQIRSRYPEAFH